MKKDEVKVGTTYSVKVSGNVVPVRITEEKWSGSKHVGWVGVNTESNRSVRIKSAQRLRSPAELNGHAGGKKKPAAPRADHSEQLADDPAPTPAVPPPGGDVPPGGERAPQAAPPPVPATDAPAGTGVKGRGKRQAHQDDEVPSAKEVANNGHVEAVAAKRAVRVTKPEMPKRLGGLDVAAQVLASAGKPMNCKELVGEMLGKKLWTTTGKTPEATIYAAIIREIQAKGTQARFRKTERAMFEANTPAPEGV